MRYIILMLVSFNLYAADCQLKWVANPVEEKVDYYSIYKDGAILARVSGEVEGDPVPTNYDFVCDFGAYAISATNTGGEGQISEPVSLARSELPPSTPSGFTINIINNITVNP